MTEPAYDFLIRGGRVATASDVFEADVAISGETIAAIGRRLPGARFHVTVHELIDFTPSGDDSKDVPALTAAVTARLEQIIRDDPGQWLWIHNRWPTPRDAELMRANA